MGWLSFQMCVYFMLLCVLSFRNPNNMFMKSADWSHTRWWYFICKSLFSLPVFYINQFPLLWLLGHKSFISVPNLLLILLILVVFIGGCSVWCCIIFSILANIFYLSIHLKRLCPCFWDRYLKAGLKSLWNSSKVPVMLKLDSITVISVEFFGSSYASDFGFYPGYNQHYVMKL